MSKIKSLLYLIALLLPALAWGQKKNADNSLLWQVSGNGLNKPSYLFGTIHLICKGDYLWTTRMKKSLKASDKVCFEMDLDDHETMVAAAGSFIDTSGKALKDYYTAAEYQTLKKFIKDTIGMDIGALRTLKPVALQSLIEMKVTDCSEATSYEENIMREALKGKKEILGLEPVSEQIDVLGSLPSDSVARDLLEGITHFAQSKADYRNLINTYRKQDINALYGMLSGNEGLGASKGTFLDDRNKRWISRMSAIMKNHSVFFAVGAGHLPGGEGVIALLRKNGYTVTPLH